MATGGAAHLHDGAGEAVEDKALFALALARLDAAEEELHGTQGVWGSALASGAWQRLQASSGHAYFSENLVGCVHHHKQTEV